MQLAAQAKQILENFKSINSEDFLTALNQIQNTFQNDVTRQYLLGKTKVISETIGEVEKKKLCKNLLPYFDWYLQGL